MQKNELKWKFEESISSFHRLHLTRWEITSKVTVLASTRCAQTNKWNCFSWETSRSTLGHPLILIYLLTTLSFSDYIFNTELIERTGTPSVFQVQHERKFQISQNLRDTYKMICQACIYVPHWKWIYVDWKQDFH